MGRGRCAMACTAAVGLLLAGCGSTGDDSDPSGSATASGGSSSSFDAADFFKGKTVRMIVSSTAGGNTDIFARFIAPKMAEEIPGKPRIVVTNEGGLGGIGDAYEAPASDLVLGVASRSSLIYGTASDPAAKQDPNKLQLVGGLAGGDPRAWAAFGALTDAYPSLADAIDKPDGEKLRFAATVGGAGEVESDVFLYSWLCENLKLPCEYVNVAEDSSVDTNLMVQRGEVNLQGGTMVTFMRQYLDDLKDGKSKFLFQYAPGDREQPALPDGITAPDIKTVIPADKQADYERIIPIITQGLLGNMIWAGPAMSADVVKALGDAYGSVVANQDNVSQLEGLMAGGDSPYEFKVEPLAGADAQKAYDTSTGQYEDNKDYIEGLRQDYVKLWQ
jgi:hypothetical protein